VVVGMSLRKKVESGLHVKDKHGPWTEFIWKNEQYSTARCPHFGFK